jgi:hypothetical protein
MEAPAAPPSRAACQQAERQQGCPSLPPGSAECGTIDLVSLGTADWTYVFGPEFEPDGRCFDVDGTLTLTLLSDGSTISGPLRLLSQAVRGCA